MSLSEIIRDVTDTPCAVRRDRRHVGLGHLPSIPIESTKETNRPSIASLCNKNPTRTPLFYRGPIAAASALRGDRIEPKK